MIRKIVEYIKHRAIFQPYKSLRSDIGFKAIGRSSDFRTLRLTEGRTYVPSACTIDHNGYCTDFFIITDDGETIKVANSDIGTLFKVVPFVRLPVLNDETDELLL